MARSVLVTGGFGYVGSRLTPYLLECGHSVRVLDLNLYGDAGLKGLEQHPKFSSLRSKFSFVKGDIRDPGTVSEAVKGIDTVIHLAAISNDPTGQLNETLTRQVNFDAVGVLLDLAKSSGVKRFINASSSSVFGIKADANVTEALEPEPITFYSKYKMLSEWLVYAARGPGFETVNIRPATICGYSPRQRFDLTVNKLTADAVVKRVMTVHGGEQRRPNVGITDVITLYERLLEMDGDLINGRTFNFGFENLKVIEIAQLIQSTLADLDVTIEVTETTDNRDYHISSGLIQKTLGYLPVATIQSEVRELRAALEKGAFPDIDDAAHYNMKSMKIDPSPVAYKLLSRS